MFLQIAQQRVLDLAAGDILDVQDPALRVAAFLAEIQLTVARDLPFVEMQPEFH